MPQLGDASAGERPVREFGVQETGQRGNDHVEGVSGVVAIAGRVGQQPGGLQHLHEAARPSVRHDQRQRGRRPFGGLAAHVDEVHPPPGNLGNAVRVGVERPLRHSPVEPVGPEGDEFPQIAGIGPHRPRRSCGRDVLDMRGVAHQHPPEPPGFQQRVIHRHRVDPGRLHRHVGHALRRQPACHLPQHPIERIELAYLRLPPAGPGPGRRTATVTWSLCAHRSPRTAHTAPASPAPLFPSGQDDQVRCPRSPSRSKTLVPALAAATGKHPAHSGLPRQSNRRPKRAKESRRQRTAHLPSLIHRGQPVRAIWI